MQKTGSILLIVPDTFDLYQSCIGTIATFIERGYPSYVLIVARSNNSIALQDKRLLIQKECKKIGISEVYFLDSFDYSCVTQINADLINSIIQVVNPSIVIVPFWQSVNHSRIILSKTALIACRGIGTILMYEIDRQNSDYCPSVFVPVSAKAALIKQRFTDSGKQTDVSRYPQATKNTGTQDTRYNDASSYKNDNLEAFVSHRLLLVDEEVGI
jgi:LmbE family N-acetylglucosaminyl deacetylase